MKAKPKEANPALRRGVAIIPMEGGVQLRFGDDEILVVRAPDPEWTVATLKSLNGSRTKSDIFKGLDAEKCHLLEELLGELARVDLLARPSLLSGLKDCQVWLVGHDGIGEVMGRALCDHKIQVKVEEPKGFDNLGVKRAKNGVVVCAWQAPDVSLALRVNQAACSVNMPCLFVDVSHGRHATVGPFYVPGEGACYACFRRRLHETTAAFDELIAAEDHMMNTGSPLPEREVLPSELYMAAGVASAEVTAFFTSARPLRTLNRTITVAFDAQEMWTEPCYRIPWCSACRS